MGIALAACVALLGHDDYAVRDAAQARLAPFGAAYLAEFRRLSATLPCPEARYRLGRVWRNKVHQALDARLGGRWPHGKDTAWFARDARVREAYHADPCSDAVWVRRWAADLVLAGADLDAVAAVLAAAR